MERTFSYEPQPVGVSFMNKIDRILADVVISDYSGDDLIEKTTSFPVVLGSKVFALAEKASGGNPDTITVSRVDFQLDEDHESSDYIVDLYQNLGGDGQMKTVYQCIDGQFSRVTETVGAMPDDITSILALMDPSASQTDLQHERHNSTEKLLDIIAIDELLQVYPNEDPESFAALDSLLEELSPK